MKKFKIPTVEEIEEFEKEPHVAPLFKRVKESSTNIQNEENIKVSKSDAVSTNSESIAATVASEQSTSESKPIASTSETSTAPKTQSTTSKPPKSSNSILVSSKQQGNPVLKHVRNIPWEFADIVPDYELGSSVCALFLSIRYHQQHPDYIHTRLKELGKSYELRIILLLVDSKDPHNTVKELSKICILSDCTLILAFSKEEAGRYLETYKVYENKPADVLMEKSDDSFLSQFSDCLTTVKSINKTDSSTLLSSFGSFAKICEANCDDMALCPGFGQNKASQLYNVLHEPFLKSTSDVT